MRKIITAVALGTIMFGLQACSMKHGRKGVNQGVAKLEAKSGSKASGTLYLEDHYGGLIVQGSISGLKPNAKHAIHVHEKGDCKAKDASSAGDHFAHAGQAHGAPGSKDSHAGDLGNIQADKDGKADVNIYVKGINLKANSEGSVVGRSLIVHAGEDDLKSQPSGNSGKRIACGVIESQKCDDCSSPCASKGKCQCESCKMKSDKACDCKDCKSKGSGCKKCSCSSKK